jgi:GntR family transcriptional regulator
MENCIDRNGQLQLYVQIYAIIKRMIDEGEWQPSGIIPSEDDLCRTFAVSKTTVRQAISDLVRDGYLRKQQGKGTFVKNPVPNSGITMKTRISDRMVRAGVRGERETLESGVREAKDEVRNYLKFDDSIFYAQCLESEDGEPAYIEELFAPLVFFPGIEGEEICSTSFVSLIRERSIRKLSRIVQTIEVCHAKDGTALLLKVMDGHPALLMHRVFIDSESRSIAYIRLCGKGGKYRVDSEFERIR